MNLTATANRHADGFIQTAFTGNRMSPQEVTWNTGNQSQNFFLALAKYLDGFISKVITVAREKLTGDEDSATEFTRHHHHFHNIIKTGALIDSDQSLNSTLSRSYRTELGHEYQEAASNFNLGIMRNLETHTEEAHPLHLNRCNMQLNVPKLTSLDRVFNPSPVSGFVPMRTGSRFSSRDFNRSIELAFSPLTYLLQAMNDRKIQADKVDKALEVLKYLADKDHSNIYNYPGCNENRISFANLAFAYRASMIEGFENVFDQVCAIKGINFDREWPELFDTMKKYLTSHYGYNYLTPKLTSEKIASTLATLRSHGFEPSSYKNETLEGYENTTKEEFELLESAVNGTTVS